jgi:hypothetical protein
MQWEGEIAKTVHFNFQPIVETGRTSAFASSLYPSGNGQNIDPRVRPCYEAREGFLLASVDYSGIELTTTGQVTYDLLGASTHRDKINAGYDLHSYLGGQLALYLHDYFGALCVERGMQNDADEVYRAFLSCKKIEDEKVKEFYKTWRKFAKPVGLGLPGGLGPLTLIEIARKTYGVDFVKVAEGMPNARFEADPDVMDKVLFFSKTLFRRSAEEFRWNARLKGIALATLLKNIWLKTYPEMEPYFEHVKNCKDENNPVIGRREDGRPIEGLCYTTLLGMHRAGCSFTKIANGMCMQSPTAEGAKIACFNVTRACRDASRGSVLLGAHPVDFVHDELLVEVQKDKAHTQTAEVQRIMERSMSIIVTDVTVRTEAVLMPRWYKQAEPVFENGQLVAWTPEEK